MLEATCRELREVVALLADTWTPPQKAKTKTAEKSTALVPTGAKKEAIEKRARWDGDIGAGSRAVVEQVCQGFLDGLKWGVDEERARIMEALATTRAAAFSHDRWTYNVRDCGSVGSLLKAGNSISRVARAIYGASRDKWHRQELGTVEFQQVWNKIEVYIKNVERPQGRGKLDKGEAIRLWREAFEALPAGRQMDWDDEQEFTVMTSEQIALEAEDMRKIGRKGGK